MWLRECQHFCRESLWCHNKGITLDDHRRSHSHTITWESFVRRCLWDRFSSRVENSSPWLKQVQTRWIAATIFDRLFEKWLFLNLVFVFNFVRFIASVWLCLFMKKEKVFVAGESSLCKVGRFIWACGEFASENFKIIWFSGRNWLPKWKKLTLWNAQPFSVYRFRVIDAWTSSRNHDENYNWKKCIIHSREHMHHMPTWGARSVCDNVGKYNPTFQLLFLFAILSALVDNLSVVIAWLMAIAEISFGKTIRRRSFRVFAI